MKWPRFNPMFIKKKKKPIASYLFSDVDVEFYMIDGLMVHIN